MPLRHASYNESRQKIQSDGSKSKSVMWADRGGTNIKHSGDDFSKTPDTFKNDQSHCVPPSETDEDERKTIGRPVFDGRYDHGDSRPENCLGSGFLLDQNDACWSENENNSQLRESCDERNNQPGPSPGENSLGLEKGGVNTQTLSTQGYGTVWPSHDLGAERRYSSIKKLDEREEFTRNDQYGQKRDWPTQVPQEEEFFAQALRSARKFAHIHSG